jgi:hypothetical protein
MRRLTYLTFCGLSIVAGVWASAPVEKSILVTVLDKDGAPIRDLAAEEFMVREDGARREVTGAELAREPLFVSMIIDTSSPSDGGGDRTFDPRRSRARRRSAVFKAGASVWAVSVHGAQGGTAPRRDTTLNHLTKVTGGVRATALVPSALESILTNLARNLTSQYVATYMRPDGVRPKEIVPSAKRGSKFLMSPFVQ